MKPVVATASLTLDAATHGQSALVANAAAGMTVTLPSATGTGDEYTIYCGTTVTSNALVVQVTTTDIFAGGVSMSTDIGGTNMLTAATSDTISQNGSTTGGLAGSWIKVKDIASGVWMLDGFLRTTGTEATPFSAAVS